MELHFRDISNHNDFSSWVKKSKDENKELHIEIGYGSGIVLRDRVLKKRDALHVGFEVQLRFVYRLKKFISKFQVENLYVEGADAKYMIPRFLEPESVDRFYIYYPDPWWKKKHKKYMLFDYNFISDLYRTMKKGAVLNIKTDVEEYYQRIVEMFDKFGYFEKTEFDDQSALKNKSSFEQAAILSGNPLFALAFKK
ncbi:hypothetical protein JXR93_12510 [bacterium]|nr:hypothetical protein [bacterium]